MRRVAMTMAAAALVALPLAWAVADRANRRALRVCADPNNLPFSDRAGGGFENRIAALFARDLDARLEYTWWPQRRGFIRHTLRTGACDVIVGIPSSHEMALASRPYYRSTYVFVTRAGSALDIRSLDDPRLRKLRIGVTLIGDDYANAPPAHALARRGIVDNVRGYSVYGDYRLPSPPARLIDAVVGGEIDMAIAWGPLAGYFASRSPVALRLETVTPAIDLPYLPFVYDIGMGVRREDTALRDEIDRFLASRRPVIDSILAEYGVPRVDERRPRS